MIDYKEKTVTLSYGTDRRASGYHWWVFYSFPRNGFTFLDTEGNDITKEVRWSPGKIVLNV